MANQLTQLKGSGDNLYPNLVTKPIETNDDLDDTKFWNEGFYATASAAVTNSLANCPVTGTAIQMIVFMHGSYPAQMIITNSTIFTRWRVSNGWQNWYKFTGTQIT